MKFLAIFMTVLIFTSGGLDHCAEAGSCNNNETTELHASGKEKEAMGEMCSPFCNCASCSFSILLPEKINEPCINYSLMDSFGYILNAVPLKIGSSIWQPPKVA
jgi:hypothetical protein